MVLCFILCSCGVLTKQLNLFSLCLVLRNWATASGNQHAVYWAGVWTFTKSLSRSNRKKDNITANVSSSVLLCFVLFGKFTFELDHVKLSKCWWLLIFKYFGWIKASLLLDIHLCLNIQTFKLSRQITSEQLIRPSNSLVHKGSWLLSWVMLVFFNYLFVYYLLSYLRLFNRVIQTDLNPERLNI